MIKAASASGLFATATCLTRTARAQPVQGSSLVAVDLSQLHEGQLKIVAWRDKPVWVLRRSPPMLAGLSRIDLIARLADPASEASDLTHTPRYARNNHRSVDPQVFVGLAICPHAGCQPLPRLEPGPNPERPDNWPGGFACQCHFATFDLAGRVFKDKPARENIQVPRHMYVTPTSLVLGRDEDGEA
ncbi:MAG: ubiquinol-cytochrome c reductase iron-sulfur subunit [Piscinibacter sp.]